MQPPPLNLDCARPARTNWPVLNFIPALLITFLLQFFLISICALDLDGTENLLLFALLIDFLIVLRLLLAIHRREQSPTGYLYLTLLYTSPLWLLLLFALVAQINHTLQLHGH